MKTDKTLLGTCLSCLFCHDAVQIIFVVLVLKSFTPHQQLRLCGDGTSF